MPEHTGKRTKESRPENRRRGQEPPETGAGCGVTGAGALGCWAWGAGLGAACGVPSADCSPSWLGLARGGRVATAGGLVLTGASTVPEPTGALAPSVRPGAAALMNAAIPAVRAPAPKMDALRTRLTLSSAASRLRWAAIRSGIGPCSATPLTTLNLPQTHQPSVRAG